VFEFHGWIRIWAGDLDEITMADEHAAIQRIQEKAAEAEKRMDCWFELKETFNNQHVLVLHGLRNHPQTALLELFNWIGVNYPMSYGLLYIHNEEDVERSNEFVVYRLAHGKVTEFQDSFLSPYIPTIGHAFDPEKGNSKKP
jgi:hypothetical protein